MSGSQSELDRLLLKQANLYRLQQLVDHTVMGARKSPHFVFNEAVLKQLHHVGMNGLIPTAGEYRMGEVTITNAPHKPPSWLDVSTLMKSFFEYLSQNWAKADLIHLSAFVLWRLNWIHPFENGNGRTARAASYLVLCAKHGGLLPAKNTVLEQIVQLRPAYYQALRDVDAAYAATNNANTCLEPLKQYLSALLMRQLKAAFEA